MNPRRRWSPTNPVDGAELPAIKKSTEIRFLTLEEVDALIRTPKSLLGSRAVPMGARLSQELAAFQPRDACDTDLVFVDPINAGPLNNAAILRRYRRALKSAGLGKAHVFHDLRHTFGTRAAARGVPMRTLQEWGPCLLGVFDLTTPLPERANASQRPTAGARARRQHDGCLPDNPNIGSPNNGGS
jgi:hypothetical protein